MNVHYEKVSLDQVMKYYIDSFKADIYDFEYFIDPSKDTVIFKLMLNDDTKRT